MWQSFIIADAWENRIPSKEAFNVFVNLLLCHCHKLLNNLYRALKAGYVTSLVP